jgi:hypothetical protein
MAEVRLRPADHVQGGIVIFRRPVFCDSDGNAPWFIDWSTWPQLTNACDERLMNPGHHACPGMVSHPNLAMPVPCACSCHRLAFPRCYCGHVIHGHWKTGCKEILVGGRMCPCIVAGTRGR